MLLIIYLGCLGKTFRVHPFKYPRTHSLARIDGTEMGEPTTNMMSKKLYITLVFLIASVSWKEPGRLEKHCIMVRHMDSVAREHEFEF